MKGTWLAKTNAKAYIMEPVKARKKVPQNRHILY